MGIRWLTRANNVITWWKIAIPVFTIIVLLGTHFHIGNFTAGGGFFVHGSGVKRILIAIPSGGIVFSLLGFEQAVQLGGEAANPKRDLPRAVILSIIIGAGIYILLQFAFIGSLAPVFWPPTPGRSFGRREPQSGSGGVERGTVLFRRPGRGACLVGVHPPP